MRSKSWTMSGGTAAPWSASSTTSITGTDFLVVLNHLARHDVGLRQQQAKALRLWAAAQTLPVVAMGDFNFDYSFATQAGNAAFTEFLSDDTWKWVRPDPLVDTNWADHDGNGSDDYPDSMLDFVFVAGQPVAGMRPAASWSRGDFPDDQTTSDHRPVSCVIDVPQSAGDAIRLKRTTSEPAFRFGSEPPRNESEASPVAIPPLPGGCPSHRGDTSLAGRGGDPAESG